MTASIQGTKSMSILLRSCPALLTIVLLGSGCSDPAPKSVSVTGKVLLDGKPMSDGEVYFLPTDGRVPVQAKIVDGRFSLQPLPGEYRVSIQQERDSGTKNMYGDPQMISTIPSRYNTETTLKATVTPDGPKEFEFEVHSK